MMSGRTTAAVLAVLFWCATAAADTFVKITQTLGKDGSGTGCSSATLIGWTMDCTNGIFISCAHGYDPQRPVAVQIEHDQDRTVEGRILAIDRDLELSLIAVPVSRSTEMLRLAERSPRTCDSVRLVGFPEKKFVSTETQIAGRFWSRDACTSRWTLYQAEPCCPCPVGYQELQVTCAVSAPGLSGGAVIRNRKLAGVVIGRIENAHNAGLVVPGETVRRFVQRNITLFYRR